MCRDVAKSLHLGQRHAIILEVDVGVVIWKVEYERLRSVPGIVLKLVRCDQSPGSHCTVVKKAEHGLGGHIGKIHNVLAILRIFVISEDVLAASYDLDFTKSTHESLGADTLDAVSVCTLSKTRAIVLTGIVSATVVHTSFTRTRLK